MNFLAHAYLSGDNDEILFGNFIADAVKGNGWQKFSSDIQTGIKLHRLIDVYTDRHPVFRRSLGRIRENFGKYSGIVVDIYYDHFLAKNWADYSKTELATYADHVYRILQDNYPLLPERTKKMLPYLVSQNWLVGYADFRGLGLVFYGMDRRTGLKSGMKNAIEVLQENYEELKSDFREYLPELVSYSNLELENLLKDRDPS
jgi:acyl carrier protein phosphodiesterase